VTAPTQTQSLLESLQKEHVLPLWDRYKELNTREPQYYQPMIWPWRVMEDLVDRTAKEVSMSEAERRVLLLCHPAFPGTVFTTPTLSGGLQILEPGETAPPHRHTLAALRLVMAGEGAETLTDGKSCLMRPGDLILTPAWSWHEHRHNGKGRIVWFDGLDYPLARQLGTVFFESGPGPIPKRDIAEIADEGLREGGVLPDSGSHDLPYSPLCRYEWQRVASALEAMPAAADGSKRIRYTNPTDGGPVTPTLDCYALRVGAGPTIPARTTASAIVVVIEGEGKSRIGDVMFQWKPHDVFILPRWLWVEHEATTMPATLFLMTDREFIRRIGHLREESGKR
jgi:gentisate 1,2-dioxygenase